MGDVLLMTDTAAASLRDTVSSFAPHLQILELVDGVEFSEDQLESITHAFFSADCWPDRSTPFLKTCLAAPRLKWLQSASAGGDHPVFGRFQDRGVEVLFTPGGSAPSIAQTVMMMMLALVRGLPELLDAQQRRSWEVRSTVDVGDLRDRAPAVESGLRRGIHARVRGAGDVDGLALWLLLLSARRRGDVLGGARLVL